MARRRSALRSRRRDPSAGPLEWVGGVLSPPLFIGDREEPFRAGWVVWLENPSGLVVGQELVAPEEAEGAVGRVLRAALERPLVGPRRRPDALRVADAGLLPEVTAALEGAVPIDVAPTPELDAVLEEFVESLSERAPGDDAEESYLEGGRIAPELVAGLFAAARVLYAVAPWKVATDDQVLRMDIPALGVEGACVSIIGKLGESRGVLLFPSLAGYEAFLAAAEEPLREGRRVDPGSDWLALDFERGADLPVSLRREVASHGWPVAAADAYPRVRHPDRDGLLRPLAPRDVEIAAACATSLAAFFARHGEIFEAEEFEPVCESCFDKNDREVRFTVPYEAFPQLDIGAVIEEGLTASAAAGGAARVGRNSPCPCGSGRKYKKCCLARDEEARAAGREPHANEAGHPGHELDRRLLARLLNFARAELGEEWLQFAGDFADADASAQLSAHWAAYHYEARGQTVAACYLERHGQRLSRAERAWLDAQRAAWLSVWEVTHVSPGEGMTLCDLLSGETRQVREASGSRTAVLRDAMLARVVDHGDVSLLCGAHPRPLPPVEAAEVVRRARGRLRRKRQVPVERLRDEAFGRYLIRRWEETALELLARRTVLPELTNTDGDPFLATTDHFEIAPGQEPAVEAALAALEGVEPPDPGEEPPVYTFLRPGNALHRSWENTVVGQARVSRTALALETNSRERADALRKRVEAACAGRIRHRAREHADPLSSRAAAVRPGASPELAGPEAEQLLFEWKRRYYADWLDEAIPALDGRTPRQAARTAQGRGALDVLLKDMENREQRAVPGAAFDFAQLRRQLGLE